MGRGEATPHLDSHQLYMQGLICEQKLADSGGDLNEKARKSKVYFLFIKTFQSEGRLCEVAKTPIENLVFLAWRIKR